MSQGDPLGEHEEPDLVPDDDSAHRADAAGTADADTADSADTADTADTADSAAGAVGPANAQSADTGEENTDDETVQDPAKLVRLGRMIGELLGEVRQAELDEQTLGRLRSHVEQTAGEVGDAISPDLRDELARLRTLWADANGVSQAELRVEQAQLAGWLEGVLQGIQGTLSAEQAQEQDQQGQEGQQVRHVQPGQLGQPGP